jgi:hypothetical protein
MLHENLRQFRQVEENVRVYRLARSYIEAGWIQSYPIIMIGSTLHRCASRAIETAAMSEGVVSLGPLEHFRQIICPDEDIWQWNDAPERTKEDVLGAIDTVIAGMLP